MGHGPFIHVSFLLDSSVVPPSLVAASTAGLLCERASGFWSKRGAGEVEPKLLLGGGRWSQAVSERSQHLAQAVALESGEEQ